jgi:hypothetical protein
VEGERDDDARDGHADEGRPEVHECEWGWDDHDREAAMRRAIAGVLVMVGLLAAFTALYLDVLAAVLMLLGLPVFAYGLAGYDIDARAPDDRSGW